AQRLAAAIVAFQRPREDVVAVDRRALLLRAPREGERGVRPHAVVDVEERRLEVGLDAVRLEQPADTVDGRVLRLRRTRTAGDTVEVAEVADELRKRDRRRGAALDRGRVPQVAARRLDLRERAERVDVAREAA